MIEIYTDGACDGNPGRGGWAAILVEDGRQRVLRGGERHTTNNRMEITAAIKGLEAVSADAEVTVVSDSEYVIRTMTRNWKRNANTDLWPRLDALVASHRVRWEWVRGHTGHPLNELADRVAKEEAGLLKPELPPSGNYGPAETTPSLPPRGGKAQDGGEYSKASRLTHVDESGAARMVDVGHKPDTERVAVAKGSVVMAPETLSLIKRNAIAKGDVLSVARTAGIMAAKRTPDLIPLCHPLPLSSIAVDMALDEARSAVDIAATVKTTGKTGVEMEALTAVTVAALTVYDMCKAVDRRIRIEALRLVRKTGGKSGDLILEE
ncbi:MAG: cyclic pyranopterin monophosphate synthase MoaC [SAR202 cluster bacterium]|nr:cyclic pyranopterin monophosphate synthase MoaC [SAR202 cluster bacterium]